MIDWLTVPLSFVNLLGMYLLSRRLRIGWVPTILGEICWGVYGGWTHQWGLLLGGLVTAIVQCLAWMKWRGQP